MTNLGKLITQELENKHLDQAWLTRKVRVSEATISRIVAGKRGPSIALCHKIADVLEIPRELVLEKAGIIPKHSEHTVLVSSITHKVSLLSEQDQRIILRIIETILAERK